MIVTEVSSAFNLKLESTWLHEILLSMDAISTSGRIFIFREEGRGRSMQEDCIRECFKTIAHEHKFSAERGDAIVIDRTEEAGVIRGRESFFAGLFEQFAIAGDRVVYASQNRKASLAPGGYPNWIYAHEWAIRMARTYLKRDLGSDPTKAKDKILCLNNKIRPHRVATVLAAKDKFGDDLIYSWGGKPTLYSRELATAKMQEDFPEVQCLKLDEILDNPIHYAADTNDICDLPIAVSEMCYLHLVCESDYGNGMLRFTEKILKPIACRRPFMVMGPPGILGLLRKHGFQTFDGIMDESYDTEENPQKRLNMIVASLQKVHAIGSSEVMKRCLDICEHNNFVLRFSLERQLKSQFETDLNRILSGDGSRRIVN